MNAILVDIWVCCDKITATKLRLQNIVLTIISTPTAILQTCHQCNILRPHYDCWSRSQQVLATTLLLMIFFRTFPKNPKSQQILFSSDARKLTWDHLRPHVHMRLMQQMQPPRNRHETLRWPVQIYQLQAVTSPVWGQLYCPELYLA